MSSKLVTKDNLSDFLEEVYNISDAIICIWTSEKAPKFWEIENENGTNIHCTNVDDLNIFTPHDISSLLFPKYPTKNREKGWVKVLACVVDYEKPLLGWMHIPEEPITINTMDDIMAGWPNNSKLYI